MKIKSQIEIDREIVSWVKRVMDQPRLTESVRSGFRVEAARAVEKAAAERIWSERHHV
jgi:hypothetical protein